MTPRRLHDPRPFLIAGGGIGGLSAAVALAERGIAVRVLEAEQEFSESGAGIQIGPNGSRILRSWGLEPAFGQSAAQPGSILIRDGLSGRTLASVPLGEAVRSRYGAPYYATERRLLHRALLEKASQHAAIEISSGFRLASFRHLQNGIAVISGDGVEVAGWALIGADGVHSTVRMLLFGRSASFSGRNAWRATLAEGHAAAESGAAVNLWLGRHAHLVHYRCGPQGPLNAVAIIGGAPASCLEHDPQKWIPVLRQRSCLNKELEPHSDSIGMEKALALRRAPRFQSCQNPAQQAQARLPQSKVRKPAIWRSASKGTPRPCLQSITLYQLRSVRLDLSQGLLGRVMRT
jgi:salicylate hydroxylase